MQLNHFAAMDLPLKIKTVSKRPEGKGSHEEERKNGTVANHEIGISFSKVVVTTSSYPCTSDGHTSSNHPSVQPRHLCIEHSIEVSNYD